MQQKHLDHSMRLSEARRRFIRHDDCFNEAEPKPGDVLFEIGVAMIGFLSLAVGANLLVVLLHVG
ncbi:MAG TPA: hypothetical protein VGG12_08720 [Methylovirgula sp.]|jgi:hypothetical protein